MYQNNKNPTQTLNFPHFTDYFAFWVWMILDFHTSTLIYVHFLFIWFNPESAELFSFFQGKIHLADIFQKWIFKDLGEKSTKSS